MNQKLLLSNKKMQQKENKLHYGIILHKEGDQYLMLSISTKKSLSQKNSLYKEMNQSKFCSSIYKQSSISFCYSYCVTEKIEFISEQEISESLVSEYLLTDKEKDSILDCLEYDTNQLIGYLKKNLSSNQSLSSLDKNEISKKIGQLQQSKELLETLEII